MKLVQWLFIALIGTIYIQSILSATDVDAKFKRVVELVQDCIIRAADSFLYQPSYPPTTIEELSAACSRKAEAFKCIKDKLKDSGAPGIAKRGLLSYVQGRQKYQKKYCTDIRSELSKAYLKDMQCLMKHKFNRFQELDAILVNKAIAIEKRNYTDSAEELKQICCALYTHKRDKLSSIDPECTASKEKIEESILETVTDDLSIVCDDEDRMITKTCPNLKDKLVVSNKFDTSKGPNASGLFIYLIGTLGEPNH